MLDINGIEIKVGMTVKTEQPSGGILNPAPPVTGVVFMYKHQYSKFMPNRDLNELAIKYNRMYNKVNIECIVLLKNKINEIIF